MKYYIIQEIGYEYNDETYQRPENDSGTPVNVFIDKSLALEKLDELNCKAINETDYPSSYCGYESVLEQHVDEEKFLNLCTKLGVKTAGDLDDYNFQFENLTLEQYKAIKSCLSLEFYVIVEVNG